MNATRCLGLALLLLAATMPLGLHAQDQRRDEQPAVRAVFEGEARFTEPRNIEQLWVTTPGVIFILDEMPEGVRFFSADRNSQQKLDLLLKAVEQGWKLVVVYDSDDGATSEAMELRFVPQAGFR